jgi:hypothetical protein
MAVTQPDPNEQARPARPFALAEPQPEPTPVQLSAAEVAELRAGAALAAKLRADNAALQAEKAVLGLGARVTPAMRHTLQPLLTHLLAQESPTLIQLSEPEPVEIPMADAVLRILAAIPPFESLNLGHVAIDDGPAVDARTADEVALHTRHKITPERAAELRARYQEGD